MSVLVYAVRIQVPSKDGQKHNMIIFSWLIFTGVGVAMAPYTHPLSTTDMQ